MGPHLLTRVCLAVAVAMACLATPALAGNPTQTVLDQVRAGASAATTATRDAVASGTPGTGHAGPARIEPAATTPVPAWSWSDRRWQQRAYEPGSAVWMEPFADGWSWTWTQAGGWRAVRTTSLRVDAPTAAAAGGPATMPLSGPFRASGRFLRDATGRAVFFHGVNAVWKLKPYSPPSTMFGDTADASRFDERDARLLARNGMNGVRLGVLWAGVEPTVNQYDMAYVDRMRRLAAMLGDHQVGVLVDSHQDMYTEAYRGEGFPDWARLDHGIKPFNCCVFPLNYASPSTVAVWDDFWGDRAQLWTRFRNQWTTVAESMRDLPNLLGYDLINEPWPGSPWARCVLPTGCEDFDTERLQRMQEHVTAGIRTVDSRAPIWWEGNTVAAWGSPNHVGRRTPFRDPAGNTVHSFHAYCLVGGAVPGISRAADPSCPSVQRRTMAIAMAAADRNGSAAALTEFGASDDLVDIGRMAARADEHMTSWFYWHYGAWHDPTGVVAEQGLFGDDADRDSLKPGKADLLVRTYPQAVAGTPRAFRFSPDRLDRRFALTYAIDPSIDADTVVYVPTHRHYEGGYTAAVTGPARITSEPGATLLTLRGTGAAGDVTVTIVRTGYVAR